MLNITKRFPGVLANDDVTITVDQGQILGLIGENGAGKSTMMNMLYGLLQPDEGVIKLFGKEVRIQSPNQAISMGIGMVHQHFMLMINLTLAGIIVLCLRAKTLRFAPAAVSIPGKHPLVPVWCNTGCLLLLAVNLALIAASLFI